MLLMLPRYWHTPCLRCLRHASMLATLLLIAMPPFFDAFTPRYLHQRLHCLTASTSVLPLIDISLIFYSYAAGYYHTTLIRYLRV